MHRSALALAVIALAAACDSAPTEPVPAGLIPSLAKDEVPHHEHTRSPFAQTVVNSCPAIPEPVAVEGFVIYNSQFKHYEWGNNSRLRTLIQGSGIGAISGVKYQFHQMHTVSGTYTFDGERLEADHYTRMHLISQTNLDNFFLTVRLKQVCTPGTCTVTVVSMEPDCRG